MSGGNEVTKKIDTSIANLQKVKKQWSHCVKSYIDIETRLMNNISATDGNVKEILEKLNPLVTEVTADRGSYKEHYDNILKNCTLGEMLTWAKVNGKRGKLERVIENSDYYQQYKSGVDGKKSDVNGEVTNPSEFFDYILEEFGKMKYKKIGKGTVDGESGFLISLMTAVFDSILKTYIGLVQNKDIDEKTRHKMNFGGIKGKDIEKYICKEAGIEKNELQTVSDLNNSTMISRLNVKRKSVDEMKNAISIGELQKLFEDHPGRHGPAKANTTIDKISNDCIKQIETIHDTLTRVKDSLKHII